MRQLLKISKAIDRLTGWLGRAVGWLLLAMVLIGAFNATARYLGRFMGWNLSSNLYLELQWYLFSMVFLLGGAYTLRTGGHVRVDVLYGRLSRRAQAWINTLGGFLLLLPFTAFCFWMSVPAVRNSWQVLEGSPDPGGLPRYPIKSMLLVGFGLLFLQGISELIKEIAILRGRPETAGEGEA